MSVTPSTPPPTPKGATPLSGEMLTAQLAYMARGERAYSAYYHALQSHQLDANFYQSIPSLHGADATGSALFAVAGHPAYLEYLKRGQESPSESPEASAQRDASRGVS